jgi:hypothetical protein
MNKLFELSPGAMLEIAPARRIRAGDPALVPQKVLFPWKRDDILPIDSWTRFSQHARSKVANDA